MNWLQLLVGITRAVPLVVVGIQQMHKDANNATKKQLAQEALGLGAITAATVMPDQQENVAAFAQTVSNMIDLTVQGFKQAGQFGFTPSKSLPPAPAVAIEPAPASY